MTRREYKWTIHGVATHSAEGYITLDVTAPDTNSHLTIGPDHEFIGTLKDFLEWLDADHHTAGKKVEFISYHLDVCVHEDDRIGFMAAIKRLKIENERT